MPRQKPRGLRPEEKELWKKVIEKAVPMHPERSMTAPPPPTTRAKPVKPVKTPTQPFLVGKTAKPKPPHADLAPSLTENLARHPVAMDRKRFGQMKKGRLSPEARIDLHGMTIAQAHPSLQRFILDAVADGRRLVLVITGKGKTRPDHGPIPERHGVLRHQVPHWLGTAPLKPYVLQITEAHLKHGGGGAFYVYLRKPR
jgi:DNA-nicking Smr family endonuclease